MSLEPTVAKLVEQTSVSTHKYYQRLVASVQLLQRIHRPLAEQEVDRFFIDGLYYDFDDLLMLMFEVSQLLCLFPQLSDLTEKIDEFLVLHIHQLKLLLWTGRLNHIAPVISFKQDIQ